MRYRIHLFVAVFTVIILPFGPLLASGVWTQALIPPDGITITGNEAIPVDYPEPSLAREYGLYTGMYKIIQAKQAGMPNDGKRHAMIYVGSGIDDRIPDLFGRVIHRKTFGGAVWDPDLDPHETGTSSIAAARAGDPIRWPNGQFNPGAGVAGPLGVFPEDAALIDLVIGPNTQGGISGAVIAEVYRYIHNDLPAELPPNTVVDVINCSFNCSFDSGLKAAVVALANDGILISCAAGQNESGQKGTGLGGELGAGGPWPAALGVDPECWNIVSVGAVHSQSFYGSNVDYTGPWHSPVDGSNLVGGGAGSGDGTSTGTSWVSGFLQTLKVYCGVDGRGALAKLRGSCQAVQLRADGKPWSKYGKPQLGQAFDVPVFAPMISAAFRRSKKELVIQGVHLLNCTVLVNGTKKTNKVDLSQSTDTQLVLYGKPAKLGLRDVNTVQVLAADGSPSNTFTF